VQRLTLSAFARIGQSLPAKTMKAFLMKAFLIEIPVGPHHVQATEASTTPSRRKRVAAAFLAPPKLTRAA
jgi:hypothetical protein